MLFHVLNRGVGRMQLFSKEKDYAAFGVVKQAVEFGKEKAASPVDWLAIMRFAGQSKTDD